MLNAGGHLCASSFLAFLYFWPNHCLVVPYTLFQTVLKHLELHSVHNFPLEASEPSNRTLVRRCFFMMITTTPAMLYFAWPC